MLLNEVQNMQNRKLSLLEICFVGFYYLHFTNAEIKNHIVGLTVF